MGNNNCEESDKATVKFLRLDIQSTQIIELSSLVYLEANGIMLENSACVSMLVRRDAAFSNDLVQTHSLLSGFSTIIECIPVEKFIKRFFKSYRAYSSLTKEREVSLQESVYISDDFSILEIISPNVECMSESFLINIHLDGNYGELLDKLNFRELYDSPVTLCNNSLSNYIRKRNDQFTQ